MAKLIASRTDPLAGRIFASANVTIAPISAGEGFRCNLRAEGKSIAAVSKALKVGLPQKPKTSATAAGRTAMWLGPDEWLIIDGKADPNSDLPKTKALHSAVDVSHRNTAIEVSGPSAADVINAGCPQDLSLDAFPVGACSRTIMGKVEIVLLRTKKDTFRLECWRSFSDYAFELLSTAAKHAG